MVERFKLNSRPPALSPVPFSSARQTLSPRIRPHFPALSAQNARFLRPGVPSFRSFHSSLPKSEMFDPLFSVTCTLFARIPGVYPPGAPNQKPQARILPKPIEVSAQLPLSPVSGRVIMSLFRHIVTSAFPARNLIRRPIILWRRDTEPGVYSGVFRVCTCKP